MNRTSDTIYDITEIVERFKYSQLLIEYYDKYAFIGKVLKYYFKYRFSAKYRNMLEVPRHGKLVSMVLVDVLQPVPILSKKDPTELFTSAIFELVMQFERYVNRPRWFHYTGDSLDTISPIDLPSNHECEFVFLKPSFAKRKNDYNHHRFMILGKEHYFLAIRTGGSDG